MFFVWLFQQKIRWALPVLYLRVPVQSRHIISKIEGMQYNWGTLSAQSRHINTIEGVIPTKIRTYFPSHSLIMCLSTTHPWLYWFEYVPQLYCTFSVVLMMCLNYIPRFYWQCASVVLYTLWYTQSENVLRLYITYSFWGLADSTLSRMSRISIKFLYRLYWGKGLQD